MTGSPDGENGARTLTLKGTAAFITGGGVVGYGCSGGSCTGPEDSCSACGGNGDYLDLGFFSFAGGADGFTFAAWMRRDSDQSGARILALSEGFFQNKFIY